MHNFKTKPFQSIINLIVVVFAVVFIVQEVSWWLIPGYEPDYYEGLPDEVEVLDDSIIEFLEAVPSTPEMFLPGYGNREISVEFNEDDYSEVLSANDIYSKSLDSIVYINTADEFGLLGFGSGSVIGSNGIILTNYHVISEADKIVVTFSDKSNHAVTDVVYIDEKKDIAILKIDAENLQTLALGLLDEVSIGDKTYVIGHPENFLFTLSEGLVSGIREFIETGEGKQIQITNPISGGSSGGALLNDKGELIGITTSSFEYDENSVSVQNINFAVPMDEIYETLL